MIDQPLNSYIKQPNPALPQNPAAVAGIGAAPTATTPGGVGGNGGSNMTFTPLKKKNNKRTALIGGVLAFLVLAIAGVGIALKTGTGLFAPNAPQSNPGAAGANTCSLNFTVAEVVTSPSPSPSATPSPSPTPSPTPTPTPGVTPTPSPTPSPSPSPTYSCNTTCDNDTQCQTANADYVCSSAQGNTCRLRTNVSSATCTPATGTYACNATCTTNEQCASANPNYICAQVDGGQYCRLSTNIAAANCGGTVPSPTPTIGCNETCTTNSDCSNPDHICYSNSCRLATNPTNAYCAPSTAQVTPTPGMTPQPSLPPQLPTSGPADWGNWLKAGLGALGVGAVLLLFL